MAEVPGLTTSPACQLYSTAGTLEMIAPELAEAIPRAHFAWGGMSSLTPPALPNTDSRLLVASPCP